MTFIKYHILSRFLITNLFFIPALAENGVTHTGGQAEDWRLADGRCVADETRLCIDRTRPQIHKRVRWLRDDDDVRTSGTMIARQKDTMHRTRKCCWKSGGPDRSNSAPPPPPSSNLRCNPDGLKIVVTPIQISVGCIASDLAPGVMRRARKGVVDRLCVADLHLLQFAWLRNLISIFLFHDWNRTADRKAYISS